MKVEMGQHIYSPSDTPIYDDSYEKKELTYKVGQQYCQQH